MARGAGRQNVRLPHDGLQPGLHHHVRGDGETRQQVSDVALSSTYGQVRVSEGVKINLHPY